ncbi:hypothetical protein HMPREF3038_01762 [Akkermansia sp. KLE1797]|nr:hypothetical protein HMPREF3038_01762 [Akkermansia sp. KLE1797]KXU53968.1 hypothetical protein HMPREF3039_01923 [Akkermansia sp. KLE1798]
MNGDREDAIFAWKCGNDFSGTFSSQRNIADIEKGCTRVRATREICCFSLIHVNRRKRRGAG